MFNIVIACALVKPLAFASLLARSKVSHSLHIIYQSIIFKVMDLCYDLEFFTKAKYNLVFAKHLD